MNELIVNARNLASTSENANELSRVIAKLCDALEERTYQAQTHIDMAAESHLEMLKVQEKLEDTERQLYFLRGVFEEDGKMPEDAAKAIQRLIQPLDDDDRHTFNMIIKWAKLLGGM
jgi:hypothetical protein